MFNISGTKLHKMGFLNFVFCKGADRKSWGTKEKSYLVAFLCKIYELIDLWLEALIIQYIVILSLLSFMSFSGGLNLYEFLYFFDSYLLKGNHILEGF